jgi:magnesium transporter
VREVAIVNNVKVLGEFYFSRMLGKPIFNTAGHRIGRLRDLAIRWDSASPRVTGLKYDRKSRNLIPVELLGSVDDNAIRLTAELLPSVARPIAEDELYVAKWLLDKQIIDFSGVKLVRVNDITLSSVAQDDHLRLVLVGVDIGIRGLFRRIGLEFLVRRCRQHLVGWQYIKPLQDRTSSLQLNRDRVQLGQLHPADIADIIEQMDYRSRASFVRSLDSQQAVDAMSEMALDTQVGIIEQLDKEQASDILEELPPDEAADILAEMPAEQSRELLGLMESDDAREVQELMDYPEGTAGALMTTQYVALPPELTAGQAIARLRELAPEAETIYYLYVVDAQEILIGVVSLRELILAAPDSPLESIMQHNVVSVGHRDDQRRAAETIYKYSLLAVPVVDGDDTLLGIITVDDILAMFMPERGKQDGGRLFGAKKRLGRRW